MAGFRSIPVRAATSGTRSRRLPRRARRGLGLMDAILATGVLAVMALWGGQVVGDWAPAAW